MNKRLLTNTKGIDEDSHLPKYIQLKEILTGLIKSGRIQVGEKIPSLRELTRMYKVSDTTCKKTIQDLVHEGVLKGEWGKGVFVRSGVSNALIQNISLIVWNDPKTLEHPAFSELVRGIMSWLADSHCQLFFTFLDPKSMKKEEIEEKVSNINASGVIIPFIPYLQEEHLVTLREKKIPVVFIMKRFSAISPYLVRADWKGALCEMTENILKSEKKKVAMLGSPWEEEFMEMKKIVEKGLAKKGLTLDKRLIKRGPRDFETGKKLMKELLNEGLVPDAIIANDDYVGYGALETIQKSGLQLAHNIEIITIGGFLRRFSHRPVLASISTPYLELGEEAAKMMINIVKGDNPKKKEIILQHKYILA